MKVLYKWYDAATGIPKLKSRTFTEVTRLLIDSEKRILIIRKDNDRKFIELDNIKIKEIRIEPEAK